MALENAIVLALNAAEAAVGENVGGLFDFCERLGLPEVTARKMIEAPGASTVGALRQQLAILDQQMAEAEAERDDTPVASLRYDGEIEDDDAERTE